MSTATPSPPAGPRAFDSGLTIPDFAACVSMGLQPLGLVQGFYCGQISRWSGYSAQPVQNYPCVCYETAVHNPGWLGRLDDLDRAWMSAHQTALERMVKEAADLGAHGVVGVVTEMSHPTNENSCQVHLYGTAVLA
ncbi:MAG: heavy metal-binding domain-containing protein, partial [Acidimicrobiales bacterium]